MRRALIVAVFAGGAACGINVSGSLVQDIPPPKPEAGVPEASLPPGLDGATDASADVFGAPFDPSNVDAGLLLPDAGALDGIIAIDTAALRIDLASGGSYFPGTFPAGVTFAFASDGAAGTYAVLSAGAITLGPAPVKVTGTMPLIVLANGELLVNGPVYAQGSGLTPGPGGFGPSTGPGAGANGTAAGTDDTGGGGAGHGTRGANATKTSDGSSRDADGGLPYDLPLAGGSGGGEGSSLVVPITCGKGGAGGGAVQLFSTRVVRIAPQGLVQVGGAGGFQGCLSGGGGGGGSGGTVWVEGPRVEVFGALTANGGGGGGATRNSTVTEEGTPGEDGRADGRRADGGLGGKTGGNGEALGGGRGGALAGPPEASDPNSKENSGGGGGAVGRIRVRSRELMLDGGVISPAHETK